MKTPSPTAITTLQQAQEALAPYGHRITYELNGPHHASRSRWYRITSSARPAARTAPEGLLEAVAQLNRKARAEAIGSREVVQWAHQQRRQGLL